MSCARPPTHCDILIIGAGPAGMAAALAAGQSGASVLLVDDNPAPGGQIWRSGAGAHLPPLARRYRQKLERLPNVRVLTGTRVVGLGDSLEDGAQPREAPALLLEDSTHGWTQRAGRLILCTGARELLLPFPGWTLPGVTGAGGLQALIKAGLPVRGQRIVIAGSGPLLLAAAHTARQAGATVLRIAEQASLRALAGFALHLPRWPTKAAQALSLFNPALRTASHVLEAVGEGQVQSVRLQCGTGEEQWDCDRLACGFGLIPHTHLGQMLACQINRQQGLAVDALQATTVAQVWAAGECTGFGGSEKALTEGAIAGYAAAGDIHAAQALAPQRARWQGFAQALHTRFALSPQLRQLPRQDTLVCRCEDVPYALLAQRTGWIDAKLHTRCGMGPCQGRVCGAATQFLFGWTPTPARHLLAPARIATLAATDPTPESPSP